LVKLETFGKLQAHIDWIEYYEEGTSIPSLEKDFTVEESKTSAGQELSPHFQNGVWKLYTGEISKGLDDTFPQIIRLNMRIRILRYQTFPQWIFS